VERSPFLDWINLQFDGSSPDCKDPLNNLVSKSRVARPPFLLYITGI